MRRAPLAKVPKNRQRSPEFPAFSDLFRLFPGFSNHSATAGGMIFAAPARWGRDSAATLRQGSCKAHVGRLRGRCQVGATGGRRGSSAHGRSAAAELLWLDLQSGFHGKGFLAGVEGEEVLGSKCHCGGDVQHVKAAGAERFRVRRAECLRFGIGFRP